MGSMSSFRFDKSQFIVYNVNFMQRVFAMNYLYKRACISGKSINSPIPRYVVPIKIQRTYKLYEIFMKLIDWLNKCVI